MITKTYLKISHSEIDYLGIVHHAKYPLWFETARHDFLKKAGVPYSRIRALDYCLPLSEMRCEFKSPAKYKEGVSVFTNVTYMSCVKIKFEYRIISAGNRLIAEGNTVHAWADRNIKPINIEKAAPVIYTKIKEFAERPGIE